MAILNRYEMNSYAGHFESDGGAYNLIIPFNPDSLKWWNYTKYATDTTYVSGVWFKDFPAGDALICQCIVNDGTGDSNTILETTNGVTIANTESGVEVLRADITGATAANPVVITAASHGFGDAGDIIRVRLTQVGGMTQLNDNRYQATIINANSFSLQHEGTGVNLDGTGFTAYTSGGSALDVTRVGVNTVVVAPVIYRLTLGTAVMGADGDEIYFEAFQYGKYEDLGDIT